MLELSFPQLASWTHTVHRSAIQDMLAMSDQPDVISFALGLPAPELFPVEAYQQAIVQVLAQDRTALQYGPPKRALKQYIVSLMARRGVSCKEEQIFLTTGAQQGMNLLARLFLEQGQPVLIEDIIYSGICQVLLPFQPEILPIRTSPGVGMDVEHVEYLLQRHVKPAFLYAISDGHNPLSVSMSLEQRQHLVQVARRYQVPIIEDDAYGFLWYDHEALPPLRALDDTWVCYTGSFSKILAPALRAGWLVVPEAFITQLSILKEASDIDMATFTQRTVATFLEGNDLFAHLAILRQVYKERRNAMMALLTQFLPSGTRWHVPNNGMFLWVELPSGIDTTTLLDLALAQEHVSFLPGQAFCVGSQTHATHCLRLNFSHCPLETIEPGIRRLARAIQYYQEGV